MTDEKPEKKGILTFEEGMNHFTCWGKGEGISYQWILTASVMLDGEDIGYIGGDGKITLSGHITQQDPTKIMSYTVQFTLDQWCAIAKRAQEFNKKCLERERIWAPALEKLEQWACKMFSEDEPFRHIEIAAYKREHIVLGGGKGEWESYAPGVYAYEDGEVITNIGFRPVAEQKIKGVKNLEDELFIELVRALGSMETFQG